MRVAGDQVELEIVAGDDLHSVKTDAAQVEQILLTLAVNARDAMPTGGRLTIRTGNVRLDGSLAARFGVDAGEYVELSVADSGVGIDPEAQKQLFTPFFTTKERGYGTGLGLATVHGIVKQSGGHITVESAVGRGSRFAIRFPATSEPPSSVARERLDVAQRGSETVLLVEDDGAVRGLMADVLRRRGYEVLLAPDGFEAVRIADLHDAPIHLLVTDVVMRDMSGVNVAIALRARRPGPEGAVRVGLHQRHGGHDGIRRPHVPAEAVHARRARAEGARDATDLISIAKVPEVLGFERCEVQ